MKELNDQEKKVLDCVTSFLNEKGYPPSQRELAKEAGFKSPNTVDYYLTKLEDKGYLECPKNRPRAIRIVAEALRSTSIRIPILGTVPAGVPNLAVEDYEESIEVDRALAKGDAFGLKVKGDSMKDAAILEGDIAIVRVQASADHGDIVVARFQEDTTVKYFHYKKGGPYLVPANEKYAAIPAKDAQIVGKVVGIVRRYHANQ